METELAMYDEMATEAGREVHEVALRLQTEAGNMGAIRMREWDSSMKMKEACAEKIYIITT